MKNILIVSGIIVALFLFGNLGSSGSNSYDYYEDREPIYEASLENDTNYDITSDNWDCTSDCSGHEAGYEWASDNGITHPDDCDGNSNSFIEGCQAYANEYQQYEYEDKEYYDENYEDYYR